MEKYHDSIGTRPMKNDAPTVLIGALKELYYETVI